MTLPSPEALAGAVAAREDWALDTLARWVRCASVLGHEAPAQELVAGVFEELGLEVAFEPVRVDRLRGLPGFSPAEWSYEGRPNVVGVHRPRRVEGRSLIVNGHVDVVPPGPQASWSSPPFEPTPVHDDEGGRWLVGRGAGDMKGGSVAALWALAALRDLGLEPAAELVFQSVIEEECTGNGTLALCAAGYRADGCLVPEPFDETVLVRQVGVLWFQVRVRGRTTHVLGAGRGVNAVEKSWPIIAALRALEDEENRPERVPPGYRGVEHPLNLNVGTIRGGDWASTVAGECVTRFRMGLFPGERVPALMRRVEARVAEAAGADPWLREFPPSVEYVGFQAEGCEFDTRSALAGALGEAHARLRGAPPRPLVATCTTDVRFFNLHYGVPATCYGPRAADIHGADERVSVDSLGRVAEVLAAFVTDWCGASPRPLARRRGGQP